MDVEKLIDRLERQTSELSINQATQVMGELVKLFPKMKEVQPHLTKFYMGMGIYGIDGKYFLDVIDIVEVLEDYPDLEIVERNIFDGDQEYVIYKDLNDDNFAEFVSDIHKGRNVSDDDIDVYKYLNDACFEFIKLCDYLQEYNLTTVYDGVNEDGVIIMYGRGCRFDTYIDALEYGKVEYLEKYKIPYIFYDVTKKEYHDKITI